MPEKQEMESDQEVEQRRDAMLLKLLKTPAASRETFKKELKASKPASSASAEKPAPSA